MTKSRDIGERQEGMLSSTTNTSIALESSPYSYPSNFERTQRQPTRDRDIDMEDNTVKLSGVTMSTQEPMRQYDASVEVRPPGELQPDPSITQAPAPRSTPPGGLEEEQEETEEERKEREHWEYLGDTDDEDKSEQLVQPQREEKDRGSKGGQKEG